jgi:hypothetical protein
MADNVEDLVYQQALRALTDQRATLDNLRTRAATLLSAAAIVTSFLGAEALKDQRPNAAGVLVDDHSLQSAELVAVVAFIAVVACTLYVVLPSFKRFGGFTFSFDPASMLSRYVDADPQPSTDEVRRTMIRWCGTYGEKNEPKIEHRFWAFSLGVVLLAAEILAWVIDLT